MSVRLVSQEELPGPLAGYRLIERLGRGGFGEVWKVEAPGGLMKAAKFVFGDLDAMDDDSRPAEQELKALRRVREIRHPYILSLERYDQIDGQLIIVMELADRNLWDRFRECRGLGMTGIPRDELLRYLEEAAEALDLMNVRYQIQHLDIKPQNLFLVHNHLKVGDFGLAKLLEGVRATVTGGVTPVYAAPETFEGWVSRFSDQYSLAIVFQELLTGTRPFNGSNTRQLLMQHISGTPDLAALPPADQDTIARALNKKPDDRWPSCGEMVRALKLAGLPPPPATPQATPPGGGLRRAGAPADDGSDSSLATRPAPGGRGEPTPAAKTRTPTPIHLPPLIKPSGSGGAGPGTPTPGFGPRLVTPAAPASTPGMTLNRPSVFQTGRMGSLGIAPPEKTGGGPLFPALVVAVGQAGRRVIEQLKDLIARRYEHPDRVPNIRFLYVDTDPEAVPTAAAAAPNALAPREAVLARLNRPGHYLQRESLPPVDAWMPPGALYRLARNPGSAGGVRAFGRLALFDNYRLIAQRVRQEVETFLTDAPLAEAAKNTGLELRTNRPRAYVVAGLAGGTGGGMFIDLAYLLRHELRQVGYLRPEVVGVFFVPPASSSSARSPALGNTFAALTELHHFQSARTRYETTFDRSEAPVIDADAPFARAVVLPLPKAPEPKAQAVVARLAARALFHEALTPLGRVTEEARGAPPPGAAVCQTLGLFRLSWPRNEMLAAATRRFAQRQVQRWTAKETAHLREPIASWLARQWSERKLDLESLAGELNAAARVALGGDPDRVFDGFLDPLRTRTPSSSRVEAAGVCAAFDQLLKVVGKPDCENDPGTVSLLPPLTARYEQLARDAEGQVAVLAATFLDVPQFRLAGAEEAVRQIGERLRRQVDALEPLRAELDREVKGFYGRMFQAIGVLSSTTGLGVVVGRKASAVAEVTELFKTYPRKRLQLHVLEMCLAVYRKLSGNVPEYLREISFCRGSLAELHAALANDVPPPADPADGGRLILPEGCGDLDAVADEFLAGLAPEDLLAFEQAFQKTVAKKLKGLGSVCLKPAEKGAAFRALLLQRSRAFLDERFDRSDPATAFFRYREEDGTSESLIAEAFDEATPGLIAVKGGDRPEEIDVLGTPPGEAGDRLRALAARALPAAELVAAPLPDDICFHREYPRLDLTALPQFGGHAREAYEHLSAGDHPLHARVDVPWQIPGR